MSDSGKPYDLEEIRELAALMKESELSELELRDEKRRIRLRRGVDAPLVASAPSPAVSAASESVVSGAAEEDANIAYITAPMVGTFYAKPNPKASAYVKVGDHVDLETTVCIVEAMKVFNEIPAEVQGKIVAVLADAESPVEFGQRLFRVDTSG